MLYASRPRLHGCCINASLNVLLGNGVMETSVAEYLVMLDAAVFVIDCLPNMSPEEVQSCVCCVYCALCWQHLLFFFFPSSRFFNTKNQNY